MRKIICLLLCLILANCTVIIGVGCNRQTGEDSTKLNIKVANIEGGIGSKWIEAAITRFEKEHESDVFSGGKVGVKINLTKNKNHYAPTIEQSGFDVVIDQDVQYIDWAAAGKFLDITDVVTDASDGKSIESRLSESQKSALTAVNGKYYVVPHYEYFGGLVYNVDMFEKCSLYLAENGGFINNINDKRSVGPDGKAGTYDDGLPRTYDEFFQLIDEMKTNGITPFIWSGQNVHYVNGLLSGLLAAYCGEEELLTSVSFDSKGKDVRIIEQFNGSEPIIDVAKITPENGYKTSMLAGRYYALSFLSRALANDNNYSKTVTQAKSDTEAIRLFVNGWLKSGQSQIETTGFLVEGSYWYNTAIEAKIITDASNEKCRFAWMPLPNSPTSEINDMHPAIMNITDCYMMINVNTGKDAEKTQVAKSFIKFLNTDRSLQEFTVISGSTKGLSYELTDQQVDSLNYYAKSLWKMREAADVVYMIDGNKTFIENQSRFMVNNGSDYWRGSAATSFIRNAGADSESWQSEWDERAKQYFGKLKVTPEDWSKIYKGI